MWGFLLGAAAGYVLGTRSGRERYEQIVGTARRVADNPKVQDVASQAKTRATDAVSSARQRSTRGTTVTVDPVSGTGTLPTPSTTSGTVSGTTTTSTTVPATGAPGTTSPVSPLSDDPIAPTVTPTTRPQV